MTRWFLVPVCALALAANAFAQNDDLDALLAGLGEEPAPAAATDASAPAAVEAPAPAAEAAPAVEEAPATAPVEDPFADLLAPAAEEAPRGAAGQG